MYHALVNAYAQRVRKSYIVAYFSTIVTNEYPVPTNIPHPESLGPCLDAKFSLKFHYAKRRFPITSKCRYMHEVLNIDEIKN
jgi:hypothetical protein